MTKTFPKILVSSVDVWNETSGSDTFTNLLSGYDNDKVANIYIRSGTPTSQVCDRYFFISESAVVKSIFKRNYKTGSCVKKNIDQSAKQQMEQAYQKEKQRYSFFVKHRFWIFIYIREILWRIGHWKSHELDQFVEDYKPEVFFYPIESYIHFNRINEYLAKKIGVPVIGIIWDDNFTYKPSRRNIGFLIHRYFLRKSVKKNLSYCSKVFAISPKLQRELKETFGVNAELLTKGAKVEADVLPVHKKHTVPLKLVYTGKLNYGRYGTIQQVADVLHDMNTDGIKVELDIYSGTVLTCREKEQLKKRGTSFKGFVPQDKIQDIQRDADILLMAEASEGKHKYDARLSFSTKIVDYLANGKCILAVGPRDIAPIEYLKDNDVALVAYSKYELRNILESVLGNFDIMDIYGEKAHDIVVEKHDIRNIQSLLYNAFLDVQNEV